MTTQFVCTILALLALASACAEANPYVAIPTYMASEKLSIAVSPRETRISGAFVFRRSVKVNTEHNSQVVLLLPIWFPEQNPQDKTVRDFWETFEKDTSHVVPVPSEIRKDIRPEFAAERRQTIRESLDLKLIIGKQQVPVTYFTVYSANTMRLGIPAAWKQPGFCCLRFGFDLEPALVRDEAPVSISYRLPHLRRGNQTLMCYVPVFHNLPAGTITTDTNHYSITVSAAPGCSLLLTNGNQRASIPPGYAATFGPTHEQPIFVAVEPQLNSKPKTNAR